MPISKVINLSPDGSVYLQATYDGELVELELFYDGKRALYFNLEGEELEDIYYWYQENKHYKG